MTRLYEALEVCLNEIERGADVDTVLFRYPELADELRPLLETSLKAKEMAVPAPSGEVMRRNRAKLLQRASELREQKAAPLPRRIWSVPLRRALVAFAVIAMLFVSGTGLVRAASTTLPGDNLYPVKRTWENLRLFLTFDAVKREALEFEHENERLEELRELLASGRSAKVDFAGYVTRQAADEWRVSAITVFIAADTRLPDQQVVIGAAVRVRGQTWNGGVLAERIELLPPGSRLPEVEDDELEIEEEEHEGSKSQIEEDSSSGSGVEATAVPIVPTITPVFEPEIVSIEGVVTSIRNNLIVVNGIVMDIRSAQVKGTPTIGATAKAEGYYGASGVFIVVRIEFKAPASDGGSGPGNDNGNDDNDEDDNVNDNDDNDDNVNENDNDDDNNANDDNANDNDNDKDDDGNSGGDDNDNDQDNDDDGDNDNENDD